MSAVRLARVVKEEVSSEMSQVVIIHSHEEGRKRFSWQEGGSGELLCVGKEWAHVTGEDGVMRHWEVVGGRMWTLSE